MELKWKKRGKGGGVCGGIGDAGEDVHVFVAILILTLTLIWTWILSVNEVYVWTLAVEFGLNAEIYFCGIVCAGVDDG